MQRDIQPDEIDWVFCWRTITGEVLPGARDTSMNGMPVRYQPRAVSPEEGVRSIVRSRVRTCPRPPVGPRLDQQGGLSRMGIFVWGHVTHATLVPARNRIELGVLQDAARAAIVSGAASEWALAAMRAGRRRRWAIHVSPGRLASDLAARVDAPWTLAVEENEIVARDREGHALHALEADTVFDAARLPSFAASTLGQSAGAPADFWGKQALEHLGRGGALEVPHKRPAGRGAWERWVKP